MNQEAPTPDRLNEWQLQILKNKLRSETVLRINILFALDALFRFNRTDLARFLADNGLLGYSRPSLYKILGPPVLEPDAYESLREALAKADDFAVLDLILTRSIYKAISKRQFRNPLTAEHEKSDTSP